MPPFQPTSRPSALRAPRAPLAGGGGPRRTAIRACLAGLAFAAVAGGGPAARGQALPQSVIGAASAGQADGPVKAFVSGLVPRLGGQDLPEVARARDALVNPVLGSSASGPFLQSYSSELNDALLPLTRSADARVRLNVAIVAARVAERSGSADLAPLVTALVNDASPGVVLWGIKAAKSVLPTVMSNPLLRSQDKMAPAVLAAAKRLPASAAVAEEAYDALSLRLTNGGEVANLPGGVFDQILPVATDNIAALLEFRLGLYAGGKAPAGPAADAAAANFLLDSKVWPNSAPAAQERTVGLMEQLARAAAGSLSAPGGDDEGARSTLGTIGSGFSVVGQILGSNPLIAAGKQVAGIGRGTGREQAVAGVENLVTVLKTQFPNAGAPAAGSPASAPGAPAGP